MRNLVSRADRRGFTVVELIVVVIVVVIVAAGALVFFGLQPALTQARGTARQMKDATQVRGIQQAMVIWANNNRDQYPLPSLIDTQNATVALAEGEDPKVKDTTANILSLMIWHGNISPELCVSPAEVNPRIGVYQNYQYNQPGGTPIPALAMWDPAFSADFVNGTGNVSYVHVAPVGPRMSVWSSTFDSTQAVFSNRGPELGGVAYAADGTPTTTMVNPASNTLRIHGVPGTWEGNVAYNDNHVAFESQTWGIDLRGIPITYTTQGDTQQTDVFFCDEPDDANGTNAFLSVWTKGGASQEEYVGIWD